MKLKKVIKAIRTGFWHLKKGGPSQFLGWLTPRLVARGVISPRLGPWDAESVQAYEPTALERTYGDIHVGVIMDDFSLAAWGGEFSILELNSHEWRQQLEATPIELLLVESAWNGNHGSWQYQLTGPNSPGVELKALIEYCREAGIPTAFWNKEDPPHFEDFLDTAALFDFVFTSDSNKIPAYITRLGHERIAPLAFAAAPAIHNPIRRGEPYQEGDVAFAGMYFAHKFPERRRQMELLLGAAVEAAPHLDSGLTIFSRFQGGDKRYQFPMPFSRFVVGSLPYAKMLTAYRGFKVFLNVNSVVDSPSMCARRIFEITASGTAVVSTPSAAIREFFTPNEVAVVEDPFQAKWMIRGLVNSSELRDRMVHKAQRSIWSHHTYTHRASQILTTVGVPNRVPLEKLVTVMISTNRPHQIEHVLEQVAKQSYVNFEVVLVCHGFTGERESIERLAAKKAVSEIRVFETPAEWSLGRCLNLLVEEARGQVLAKFDDDDYYGTEYLGDQLNALRYSGAGLVGKECNFLFDAALGATIRRRPEREHRYTNFVAGPTMVGHAEVFRTYPFADRTTGEDTQFLRDLIAGRELIYSADRFNFLQMRNTTGHTWDVSSAELLANGVMEIQGLHLEHVWC